MEMLTFPVKSWNLCAQKVSLNLLLVINLALLRRTDEQVRLSEGDIQAGFFSYEDNGKSQVSIRRSYRRG